MSREAQSVAIIGGGVIGAMCAWYLNKSGHDVTVIDRDRFGAACSHGNCGYVAPSHILPLPQPGAIGTTLKSLLKPNSPLKVKLGYTPTLWQWFWQFSRKCNHRDMMESAEGRHLMLQHSYQLYKQLLANEGIDCEWQERGLLFVYADHHHFESYEKTNDLLTENFGVEAKPLSGDELVKLEPALKPGLGGAWYYEGDCHLRPDKFMSAMREKMKAVGVRFVDNFSVQEFQRGGKNSRAVSDGRETIEADSFVVATGSLTPFLNKHLGCNIPIQPGKGYSLTMPKPARMPNIPLILEQDRVAITPMANNYRIGSTMEFAGYDTSIDPKRLSLLTTAAEKYLHDPHTSPIEEEWYGWRPMTWDGKPIIDRSPAFENVWIAAGHNMLGISMATGTGHMIDSMIRGEDCQVDASHFRLSRLCKTKI